MYTGILTTILIFIRINEKNQIFCRRIILNREYYVTYNILPLTAIIFVMSVFIA